jgi:hypothetical protein
VLVYLLVSKDRALSLLGSMEVELRSLVWVIQVRRGLVYLPIEVSLVDFGVVELSP